MDRLHDPATLAALREGLAGLGHPSAEVRITGESAPGETPERITESTVKDRRLKDLVEKEPSLGEAVKELDLELLD
jgi:hypothetical protein